MVKTEHNLLLGSDSAPSSNSLQAFLALLDMVEADLGRELALAIARFLVMFLKRPSGQSQFSGQLAMQLLEGGRLSSLLCWIVDHLAEDLTVEVMAAQVHMSPRNLSRLFVGQNDTGKLGRGAARLTARGGVELPIAYVYGVRADQTRLRAKG